MIASFNDVFKKADERQLERDEREATKEIDITSAAARVCLSMEQFKKYKEQYERTEASVIKAMLMLTEAYSAGRFSLETYGTKTLVYMTRLKDVRRLLDTITNDARKGKITNEE